MQAPFTQVVVWPATLLESDQVALFEEFVLNDLGARAKYIGNFLTLPDSTGDDIERTGGRSDLVFAIHQQDVGKFAIARLKFGMRWLEDVIDNEARELEQSGGRSIYVKELHDLYSWKKDEA